MIRGIAGLANRRSRAMLRRFEATKCAEPSAEIIQHLVCVGDLRAEEGKVSGLKLFRTNTTNGDVTEVAARLAEAEADVQGLVEAHMEATLGVQFLASEYSTGPVHGGRIDSLGIDENGAPAVVEFTDRR